LRRWPAANVRLDGAKGCTVRSRLPIRLPPTHEVGMEKTKEVRKRKLARTKGNREKL
jgi:hypothetical protein